MSDTEWSISGSTGAVPPVAPFFPQVMTQGIGFPLRTVEGVPPEDTGGIFNEESLALGTPMQFIPAGYEEGKYHPRGAVLTNGYFTMVANKLSLEYPYPVPDGNPSYTLPAFAPATQSNSSVVFSGHTWLMTEHVIVRSVRIWVTQLTQDTNYRIVIIKTIGGAVPQTFVLEEPVLAENAWTTVALTNSLVRAGTTITVYIDGLNSGADTNVTGGWSYAGTNNNGAPPAQGWNRNNQQVLLRIDKTDLDGTDRSSELLGFIPGTSITFTDTDNPAAFFQYRVSEAPKDEGTYVSYAVTLQEQGEGGPSTGTTTLSADVPIPQPTEYAQELAGLANPTWGTVTPLLQFDGVDQSPAADTAFGADIQCEAATFSDDWDVLAYVPP